MFFAIAGDDELQTVDLISRRSGTTIHKVLHRQTGTFLALKSVYAAVEDINDSTALGSRFSKETELLLSFDHPNVVKCHDVAVDLVNSEYKILLEFMDGGSLAGKHIGDIGELAGVARQILQGLVYLHGLGVPHWDINPFNILKNGDVAKIADFGRSRYLTTIRNHKEFLKAVSYLGPERINGDLNGTVEPGLECFAGDIWGFGMSILEAYLGRYPIDGAAPPVKGGECLHLMTAICEAEPPKAPPCAPSEFCNFISCCLRKEPESRWTAADLLKHPFILQHGGAGEKAEIPTDVP